MFDTDCEPDAGPDWGAGDIDAIAASEGRIRAEQALQARLVAGLYDRREAISNPPYSLREGETAASVIAEVALARQISHSAAQNHFGFALGLGRLPQIGALLAAGIISERVARAVVAETGGLSAEDVHSLDETLAPELADLTARKAGAAARRIVIGLDAHAATHARNRARADRHLSIHTKAHSMASLTMILPAEQAVAVHKSLDDLAQGLKYEGDTRTGSQIMVDTAVQRLTGQAEAAGIGVEIGVLMSPGALLGDEDTPALLDGYGPLPAAIARQLAGGSQAWIRRLFCDPASDQLIGRDPSRRRFDGPLAGYIRDRDRSCQRPWCDCRIRDLDHIDAYNGNNTIGVNGQGLCKRSHRTKHLPRWRIDVTDTGIRWHTPTGHHYQKRPPTMGGPGPKHSTPKILDTESGLERDFRQHIGGQLRRRE